MRVIFNIDFQTKSINVEAVNALTFGKSGGGGAVDSVNGKVGVVVLTTSDISEGSNLYFTDARAVAALASTLANYATQAWVISQGYITNVITALGYTPANRAGDTFTGDISATNLSGTNTGDQDLSGLQTKRIVVSSSLTASNDTAYTLVATATFSDPTPQEGKGFSVLIRNGTATIGGTNYSTAGTTVWRVFHSGSWANYVNQLSIGYTPENVANKATTFGTINDTLYPSVEAVTERYDCLQRTGTSIAFDRPANYGTIASPETGNITGDYTGARIGIVQLIIHNSGSAPTIPATWELKFGFYKVSQVNYIQVEWISSNVAVYSIL